jgi:DNA-binding NtrC family response regulator
VEDEPEVAKLYRSVLIARGLQISFMAEDGLEADKAYRDCDPKPFIVIMDHRMPEMTGIDAMKCMQNSHSGTKYIIISADSSIRDEAITGGASIFLEKPIQLKQLASSIEHILKLDIP